MDDKWKEIEGFDGKYLVNSKGEIYSTLRNRFVKQRVTEKGYKRVTLTTNGVKKDFLVHRLVASAFVENKENLPFVNHKDENKSNNQAENLEWCTSEYNHNYFLDRHRSEYIRKFQKTVKRFGRINQYDLDGRFIANFIDCNEASRKTGSNATSIWRCCKGEIRYSNGYRWEFAN